jgi:hypothetical protein
VTTTQIHIEPSAVVVGLPDEHLVLCHEVVGQAGMRVDAIREIADVKSVGEKITRLMPRLVVAGSALPSEVRERVEDSALAVGAVFIYLHERPDYVAIERQLESAVIVVRDRFGRLRR